MANFDAQIQALTGTADQTEMDDWAADAVKEIINILPPELKEKCMTETTLNNSSPTMDLDGVGKILYVSRLSANSGGYRVSCREVPSMHAGLTSDSSSLLYYGTVTDPVYWIQSTSDAAILNVYPSPEATQTARVYHVGYTAAAHGDITIANFPDEAEYLVVLYASIKALQRLLNNLNTNTAIDTTAFALIKAAVDQAETAADKFESATESVFGDEDTFDTAASQLTRVKDALNNAEKIIDDGANSPTGNAAGDAATYLYTEEDTELVQGALAIAGSEIQRAQAHIGEWVAIGDMRVKEVQAALAEANGYVSEAKIRMERDNQKYQWYQGQQVKLQQDYDRGIAILVSQGVPQPEKKERAR